MTALAGQRTSALAGLWEQGEFPADDADLNADPADFTVDYPHIKY
jgi:hypothetical protein